MDILDILGIQPMVVLVNLVIFVILYFVLKKLLFSKVIEHMEKREAEIEESLSVIEIGKERLNKLKDKYEKELTDAEKQAYEKMQEIVKNANEERTRLVSDAHLEADKMLRAARKEINQEKENAVLSLKNDISDLSAEVIHKLVGTSPDKNQINMLVAEILEKKYED